mmetsp:Transcript_29923/g.85765  ORF Transcript_29923/g.85765 Transcript_29923/m.85765 type:complete len:288 (-) Transcript_29923:357-1220(-)
MAPWSTRLLGNLRRFANLFVQCRDDVPAGRGLGQLRLHGRDPLPQDLTVCTSAVLDDALHGVITKLVVHQLVKWRLGVLRVPEDGAHERGPVLPEELRVVSDSCHLKALLHNVARNLVLRKVDYISANNINDVPLVLLLPVLQYALNHIISMLVTRELVDTADDPLQQVLQQVRGATLKQPLDHSATIHVRCHLLRPATHCTDDEANGVRPHVFDTFLDHVVAMHVLHAFDHLPRQILHKVYLRVWRKQLQSLLDDPATIPMVCQVEDVAFQAVSERLSLLICASLD